MPRQSRKEESIAKRARILEVATQMFMCQGFSAVSMDAIAEAAPVSKPTLYNHFTDKKSLYAAVVQNRCQKVFDELEHGLSGERSVEDTLSAIARQYLSLVFAPEAINMHRLSLGESVSFPELGKLFYESGPKRSVAILARYFDMLHEQGILHVPQPELSASLFLSMLKGYSHLELMLGIRKRVNEAERENIVKYVVEVFIHGHIDDRQ